MWWDKSTGTHKTTTVTLGHAPRVITRALRAHTPRAPCCLVLKCLHVHVSAASCNFGHNYIVDDLYLDIRGQLCAWAEGCCMLIVGTVEGCGYDGQQNDTICDSCRPCHSIPKHSEASVLPNSTNLSWLQVASCLDVEIWRLFLLTTTTTESITLPLVHVRGVKMFSFPW